MWAGCAQIVQRGSHPGKRTHLRGLQRIIRENAPRDEGIQQQHARVILAADLTG